MIFGIDESDLNIGWRQLVDGKVRADFWPPAAARYWHLPLISVAVYAAFIFLIPPLMAKLKKPLPLQTVFTFWNLFLSVFSFVGVAFVVPELIERLTTFGFDNTMCKDTWDLAAQNPWVGRMTVIFILSKIPELGDTVLLILLKKPVSFLHWYHHITVLLFCWDALANHIAYGSYFVAMNYTVHAFMYGYFGLMGLSDFTRKLVKPIAPIITTMQLAQMFAGMVIIAYAFGIWMQGRETECYVTPNSIVAGMIMYGSYFVLFALFFYDHYLRPKKAGKKGEPSSPTKTKKVA